ncbi:MAG TPA: hypothetical protein VJ873_09880, partial [bacterium]|nr:hypothetical protein [bacterium]
LPPQAQGNNTVQVTGNWKVDETGDFLLETQTSNILQVLVDGRKVLDVKIGEGNHLKSARLHLSSGNHPVEVRTALIQDIRVPQVTATSVKGGWRKPLDELSGGDEGTFSTPNPVTFPKAAK